MKSKRLTKNIRKKQDFCEFELKKCRYQDIYGFEKYKELEEYADCDLTLAIDKLGQLEDIEERLSKYEEIGISGLVDLFKNLTDEDIEYIVQLAFKKRRTIYDVC